MLGAVATATRVRLIVWRRDCDHHPELDRAAMAARSGGEMAFGKGWPLRTMTQTRLTGTMS